MHCGHNAATPDNCLFWRFLSVFGYVSTTHKIEMGCFGRFIIGPLRWFGLLGCLHRVEVVYSDSKAFFSELWDISVNYFTTISSSPQNIFMDDIGAVRFGDLGLAREFIGSMDLARTTIGSAIYMSPKVLQTCASSLLQFSWIILCYTFFDCKNQNISSSLLALSLPQTQPLSLRMEWNG